MKDYNDYHQFIKFSLDSFSFKNYNFGSKWLDILKKTNNSDLLIKNLPNFRNSPLIIGDHYPATKLSNFYENYYLNFFLKNPIKFVYNYIYERLPFSLAHRKMIKEQIDLLLDEGASDIINSFPVSKTPGNPNYFKYKNFYINERALKQYYYMNIINKYLSKEIHNGKIKTVLDIGGGYGFYNALFKTIHPKTTQILIDFPHQLIFAYYFFKEKFPNAKILDIRGLDNIDLNYEEILKYDFILIPTDKIKILKKNTIDIVSNFFSLGEMTREVFENYLKSEFYKTSKYEFLCNRYESSPYFEKTYDNDLSILDYKIEKDNIIYFGTFPLHKYYIKKKYLIFSEKGIFSSNYFLYLGHKSKNN